MRSTENANTSSAALPSAKTGNTDIAIIGAGPAGLAAARALSQQNLRITIIDEQPRAGGQILRQPPSSFKVSNWLPSSSYERFRKLVSDVEQTPNIDWRLQHSAVAMFTDPYNADRKTIWLENAGNLTELKADTVILAQGCYERPFAFPGWTTPGVMGAGAIQTLFKSQQILAGSNLLFAGTHPLQLIVADQLLQAGANIKAVLFAQPLSRALGILKTPMAFMRQWRNLTQIASIIMRLRKQDVPVLFSHSIVSAEAGNGRVASAQYAPLTQSGEPDNSKTQNVDVDCVGLCFGFLSSTELARQAGAACHWDKNNGGWIVSTNSYGETSIPNLYAVGELTGQSGGNAAIDKGILCAQSILRHRDLVGSEGETRSLRAAKDWRIFARALNKMTAPPPRFLDTAATKNTLLCRCECISHGDFIDEIERSKNLKTMDSAKLLTRVGMGACQGRQCYINAARIVSEIVGAPISDLGPFAAQAPIKPVPLGAFQQIRPAADQACPHAPDQ